MTHLDLFKSHPPAIGWRWRDAAGKYHKPSDMETRHLFFTLRMIWNNFMPVDARVGAVRLYTFPPEYSKEYLLDAIYFLGNELTRRDNIQPDWLSQLKQMAKYLSNISAKIGARSA